MEAHTEIFDCFLAIALIFALLCTKQYKYEIKSIDKGVLIWTITFPSLRNSDCMSGWFMN